MKPQQTPKESAYNLLATCGAKVDAVLRQKDLGVGEEVRRDLRGHDRLQYQVRKGLLCTIQQPGGGSATFLIQPYNISQSGVGLLHGSFVYPGTACSIELSMPDGRHRWVAGVVVRCTFVTGKIHDIGVKFDEEMSTGWYDQSQPTGDSQESNGDLPALCGSVLLFTVSKNDRDLARFALGKFKVDVTVVSSLDEALELAGQSKHNLVMATVWDEDDGQGFELIQSLRAKKYPFPIVGLVGMGMDEVKTRAIEAGCTDVIESLTAFDDLTPLMSKYLSPALGSQPSQEPLVSSQWSDVSFRPMILQFLDQLEKSHLPALQRTLSGKDWKALRCICRDLRATSAAYGYAPVAEAAALLQSCSTEDGDKAQQDQAHAALVSLIGRACSSNRTTP